MTPMPKLSSSMEATMSKIGRVNLELQEQANELGYDTVQEAIADGWEANEIAAILTKKDELEEAHKAWLKEKKDVLEELDTLNTYFEESIDAAAALQSLEEAFIFTQLKGYVKDAIEFIKKGEV